MLTKTSEDFHEVDGWSKLISPTLYLGVSYFKHLDDGIYLYIHFCGAGENYPNSVAVCSLIYIDTDEVCKNYTVWGGDIDFDQIFNATLTSLNVRVSRMVSRLRSLGYE